MLLAVPFGALADRFGRKRILLVALFGMFMNDAWIRLVCKYTASNLDHRPNNISNTLQTGFQTHSQ